ncbi:hypothetical protein [Tunicatimonas pelagia]|uniref:hypothetical protein n=1 Tax=Tunicatimonas pelagia TaxID=931531 RepID=UPI0026651D37|nr:hypothetical protein [Tunicatimonas pelagia]WKN45648.1 hypothetical protein P0M28_11840 [Tunicatimonas pelagia]
MQRIRFTLLILLVASWGTTLAQSENEVRRWGVEFSPVGAGVFQLFQGKATYLLWPNKSTPAEVGLGLLLQPQSTSSTNEGFNSDGTYSAVMASLAYRQYYWRGLHTESVVNFGQGSVADNVVDGGEYSAFQLFVQHFAGYKFRFLNGAKINFYAIPQFGIGYVPLDKEWPTTEDSGVFFLGDLKVGINF